MRLFIADDSEILRSRLVKMLSEFEEIEVVGQAKYARGILKPIKELNPDIIILDIQMPDRNGIKVLEEIRENNIPGKVIIFTNYPYVQYRKRCMELGADFFFYKATEFENLIDVLKQLIPHDKKTEKP